MRCNKIPSLSIHPDKTTGIYCVSHAKEGMVDVRNKRCQEDGCNKIPNFQFSLIKQLGIYCVSHSKEGMIDVKSKRCQKIKCKQNAIYGLEGKRAQYCEDHKDNNMVNVIELSKCYKCDNMYDFLVDDIKYCLEHHPDRKVIINLKRLCKYCDIEGESNYICDNCKQRSSKKELGIIRHMRKNIRTPFEYNSSKMLVNCSKKRPDAYFELSKHCVIVEIDEHQHKSYSDSCECSRLNEIVNGIGGKSVVVIRYNPDNIKHKGNKKIVRKADRWNQLIKTVKAELDMDYDHFNVKLIQLYYDDDFYIYQPIKITDITDIVAF